MTYDAIVELVDTNHKKKEKEIAELLVSESIKRGSMDNVSCIFIRLK